MPSRRVGFTDSFHAAQLQHISGSAYPAALTTAYLAIYAGSLPLSDGSGGSEISPATRPSVTFGSVQIDANGRPYIANTSAISNIVLTNTSQAEVVGYGICSASSGGTPVYIDLLPYHFPVAAGQTISLPVGAIKLYAGWSSF